MGDLQTDTQPGNHSPGWELKGLGTTSESSEAGAGEVEVVETLTTSTEPKGDKFEGAERSQREEFHEAMLTAIKTAQTIEFAELEEVNAVEHSESGSVDGSADVEYVGDPHLRTKKRQFAPEVSATISDPLKFPPIAITKIGTELEGQVATKQEGRRRQHDETKSPSFALKMRHSRSGPQLKVKSTVESPASTRLPPSPSPKKKVPFDDSKLSARAKIDRLRVQLDEL